MALLPFTDGTISAIMEKAMEAEVGVAITFHDDTDLIQARNRLYDLRPSENLQISVMDNPKEIWILHKAVDLVEIVNGQNA